MATFLIGDVQGCYDELRALLETCGFDAARDHAIFLGDLVNRGPKSLEVLQFVRDLDSHATVLLGNHDLHLLAAAHGVRKPTAKDTLDQILHHPQCAELIHWLRNQKLAHYLPEHKLLCIHAGVLPQWGLQQTLCYANELEQTLQSDSYSSFLHQMYGNQPLAWHDSLQGAERLRVIVNTFTRLRFCNHKGEMELKAKEGASAAPAGYMPWFTVPERAMENVRIAFGHWSTLGLQVNEQIAALDTGCVWGGALTALRIADTRKCLDECVFQLPCRGYLLPG